MKGEARLAELGLVLPEPLRLPPGLSLPFPWVRVPGNRVHISGHGPQGPDGSPTGPLEKVGVEVSLEQTLHAARLTALAILDSLKRSSALSLAELPFGIPAENRGA